MNSDVILVIVVGTALAFDFTNGFHDTANVAATAISTRAIAPRPAVALAVAAQLRRGVHLAEGGRDGRQGLRRHPRGDDDGGVRRPDRRDRLEPAHLVLRAAVELLARADRRPGRLGVGRRRARTRSPATGCSTS